MPFKPWSEGKRCPAARFPECAWRQQGSLEGAVTSYACRALSVRDRARDICVTGGFFGLEKVLNLFRLFLLLLSQSEMPLGEGEHSDSELSNIKGHTDALSSGKNAASA